MSRFNSVQCSFTMLSLSPLPEATQVSAAHSKGQRTSLLHRCMKPDGSVRSTSAWDVRTLSPQAHTAVTSPTGLKLSCLLAAAPPGFLPLQM